MLLVACNHNTQDKAETENNYNYMSLGGLADVIEYSLDDLLYFALKRREGITRPSLDNALLLTQGRTPAPLPHILREQGNRRVVNLEEAIHDVNILFQALYSSYGGYVYFGGNEVFLTMRDRIIGQVVALGDMVRPAQLEEILIENLSPAIIDNHFRIGNVILGATMTYYRTVNAAYYRTENGFRNRENGLYLQSIQGHEMHDLEDIMHLHLDREGILYYSPVFLTEGDIVQSEAVFVYEDETYIKYFWIRVGSSLRSLEYPTLKWVGTIPVVTVMAMGFDRHENAHNINHFLPFMSFAEQLQNEPVIVVDLRSNGGGNGLLPVRWLYKFLGEIVPANHLTLFTELFDIEWERQNPYNRFSNSLYSVEHFDDIASFHNGHYIRNTHPEGIVDNEQLFVIITDRFVGSAAEVFVDLAFSMSNTLVIGAPTAGVLTFSSSSPLTLPNSGIEFGFGQGMYIWPKNHFAEGAGIRPDIWTRGDALDAALNLLKNSGFGD